ncbi:hypothetical protein CEXT_688441, partial [Caerostris extrusa]
SFINHVGSCRGPVLSVSFHQLRLTVLPRSFHNYFPTQISSMSTACEAGVSFPAET